MNIYTKLIILSTALIGTTVIVGCNNTPQNTSAITKLNATVKTEVRDPEVTTNVKTALHADEKINRFDIAVATLKGDVRLTGIVDHQGQIDYIIKLVRSVEGVHSIHNELAIKNS
jgi:hyperosmotically inducible periplasmic protein